MKNDYVAFIVHTTKNKFRGFVAKVVESPGDNDSVLAVTHSSGKYDTVQQAQQELNNLPPEIKKYPNPIESSFTGISWLSEVEKANQ